jgi:hypothetical protein
MNMDLRRFSAFAVVATLLAASGVRGQMPGVPSAPAPPAAPAVPGVPGAPAAPSNIWSYLSPSADQLSACKQKFCAHPIGQFINNMLKPATLFSGGLISPCCPPDQPNPNDLNQPATSAQGAAAAIMADEAGAKARRSAMRYLGTVDCHYWPEAEAALIGGLRTDKNECVRWEAAMSLGKGCCCTRKTIEALKLVVEGSEIDGNPAETSDRVRATALAALQHCLSCYHERPVGAPKEKPPGPTASRSSQSVAALLPRYYAELDKEPADRTISDARQTLARQNAPPERPTLMPTGTHSLAGILSNATNPQALPAPAPPAQKAPTSAEPEPILPVSSSLGAASPTNAKTPAPPRDLWHILQQKLNSQPKVEVLPVLPPAPAPSPLAGGDPAIKQTSASLPDSADTATSAKPKGVPAAGDDLLKVIGMALEPR